MNKYICFIKNWRSQARTSTWLFAHTKPFISSLLLLLALGIASSSATVGLTLVNKRIIDAATAGGEIHAGIAAFVAVVAASLAVGALNGVLGAIVNEKFAFGIRRKVYRSLLYTCVKDTGHYHSGDLSTRLTSDVDIVASGIAEVVPTVFSLIVTFVMAFATLLYFDAGLAVFALVLGPITAAVSVVLGRRVKRLQVKVQESESAYKSCLQESLENLIVLKAFEGQEDAVQRLDSLREKRLYWVIKKQKLSTFSSTAISGAFQCGYIAAFGYSALRLSTGLITYGTMTVFLSLVAQIQSPVVSLSRLIPRIVSIFASAGRIMELEALPQEDMTTPEINRQQLGLSVSSVAFGYGGEEILNGASLEIHPGEFVALMGSSGIGKTTLIRLIMSYYMPTGGKISLTDKAGAYPVTAGARAYMSYVPQGNTLMSGTIADNLRTGKQSATVDEMWRALEVVAADEFVKGLSLGLDTLIGERGLGLSEGQAQRISIARALIRGAPLLILDEATSALDERTELAVLRHLRAAVPRPACILISHRSSVMRFCDRALRIDNGRVERLESYKL